MDKNQQKSTALHYVEMYKRYLPFSDRLLDVIAGKPTGKPRKVGFVFLGVFLLMNLVNLILIIAADRYFPFFLWFSGAFIVPGVLFYC